VAAWREEGPRQRASELRLRYGARGSRGQPRDLPGANRAWDPGGGRAFRELREGRPGNHPQYRGPAVGDHLSARAQALERAPQVVSTADTIEDDVYTIARQAANRICEIDVVVVDWGPAQAGHKLMLASRDRSMASLHTAANGVCEVDLIHPEAVRRVRLPCPTSGRCSVWPTRRARWRCCP
jgi:hypothetical protein